MSKKYKYTLPPYLNPPINTNHEMPIDLNCCIDHAILCTDGQISNNDVRKYQLQCLDFIGSHNEQMNFIAHYLQYLKQIKNLGAYDIRCIQTRYSILEGHYGDMVACFFKNDIFRHQQDRILYHIIRRERTNGMCDEFKSVLIDLFPEGVSFYYNKYEDTLYVSFVAIENKEQRETYEVCKFLFADILIDIQVRWNTYPLIIGNNNCVIAAENEQRCGSFV